MKKQRKDILVIALALWETWRLGTCCRERAPPEMRGKLVLYWSMGSSHLCLSFSLLKLVLGTWITLATFITKETVLSRIRKPLMSCFSQKNTPKQATNLNLTLIGKLWSPFLKQYFVKDLTWHPSNINW